MSWRRRGSNPHELLCLEAKNHRCPISGNSCSIVGCPLSERPAFGVRLLMPRYLRRPRVLEIKNIIPKVSA